MQIFMRDRLLYVREGEQGVDMCTCAHKQNSRVVATSYIPFRIYSLIIASAVLNLWRDIRNQILFAKLYLTRENLIQRQKKIAVIIIQFLAAQMTCLP